MTPGGNAYYALVYRLCVGLAPGGLFVFLSVSARWLFGAIRH